MDVALYTVDEAAARLRVSRWMVYNLIRADQLRTVRSAVAAWSRRPRLTSTWNY